MHLERSHDAGAAVAEQPQAGTAGLLRIGDHGEHTRAEPHTNRVVQGGEARSLPADAAGPLGVEAAVADDGVAIGGRDPHPGVTEARRRR